MPKQDYDKIVKLACKPKNAPPKAKYLEALISGTFDDHALQDITRSLSLRLRDASPVIVFKALITLHKLIQAGATERLLATLSRHDMRLRSVNVSGGAGISPGTVNAYANYLDARVRAYRELGHDLYYIQNESNRRSTGLGANSKARHLRHLPVEKGLLREVKQVQRVLDAMVRCHLYENLGDDNNMMAFRMMIKDMLVFFQAGNEGVCNILEHYFEMSKVDATESFDIYKGFIKQTDQVVNFLSTARRLPDVSVLVPNLKHAPTSLLRALEEYLDDPNFEQNRLEYKRSLGVVEGRRGSPLPGGSSATANAKSSSPAPGSSIAPPATAESSTQVEAQQKIQDFLDSIDGAPQQQNAFGTITSPQMAQFGQINQFGQVQGGMMPGQIQTMPTGMGGMGMGGMGMGGMAMGNQFGTVGAMQQHQQQAALQAQMTGMNPFRQSMLPQATGVPFLAPGGQPQQQQFLQPQATGFLQPQVTGQMAFHPHRQSTFPMMSNAGDLAAQQQLQAQAQAQVQAQLQAQQTLQVQPTGFLQPQTTGSNPFRQSMMMTGGGMNFGLGAAPMQSPPLSLSPPRSNSILAPPATQSILGTPTRSNTAPMPMVARSMTTSPKPLTAQRTGSNNPFAPAGGIPSPPPQIPKLPSMNDLAQNRLNQQYTAAMGMPVNGNGNGGIDFSQPFGQQQLHVQTQAQPQQTPATASLDPFAPTATNGKSSAMSDIASAFALDPKPAGPDFASQFGGLSLGGTAGSPTSPTGAGLHTQSTGFLQPQRTGFGGSAVKPFKPTSAFGSSLMETLPSIPEPSTNPGSWSSSVPGSTPLSGPTTAPLSSSLSAPFHTPLSGLSAPSSSSGSSGFPGLHAFATGAGAGAGAGATSPTATSLSPFPLAAQPTGFQPTSSFGQSLFANSPPPTAPAPAAATHLHPQHTIQPQHTMQPLTAQATGSNPFRASMMFGAGGAGAVPGLGAGAGAGVPGSSPFGAAPFGASPFQMQQKSTQASLLS